jgi:arabinose-5-phosphate isomerase
MNLEFAREVLENEARAIASLAERIDKRFLEAAKLILKCKGRVVVTGMGKPGLIGQKISATMASTGTPSYSLHPAEALHGDLGRVTKADVVIALSNSGSTEEIVRLIPYVQKIGAKIIAITGRPESTLAQFADVVLDIGNIEEACPLGLAPTTSTSVMLAIGDALALSVQRGREFTIEEYALFHPGGSLGRKLMRVEEIMRKGPRLAVIPVGKTLQDAVLAITQARSGAGVVVDGEGGRAVGIFTDGDFRRHMVKDGATIHAPVEAVMTKDPTTISPEKLVQEAQRVMGERKFNQLPVVDGASRPIGMVDVQDLVAIGPV